MPVSAGLGHGPARRPSGLLHGPDARPRARERGVHGRAGGSDACQRGTTHRTNTSKGRASATLMLVRVSQGVTPRMDRTSTRSNQFVLSAGYTLGHTKTG